MQEAENVVYYGSLEAAARFGGRLGLRQQANLPESAAPSRPATFEDQLERMADPALTAHALPSVETKLTQWGRCGYIPSADAV